MKKIIPLILVASIGFSGLAMAKPDHQGGFNDGSPRPEFNMGGFQGGLVSATTVEQAKQLSDDSWVVLKGHIIKQVGRKNYIFKDATGEIQVEIDQKKWRGQSVTPDDLVEISGEVDKDWNSIEIDVKGIKLIPSASNVPFEK